MTEMVEKTDIIPICPYCEAELRTISYNELRAFLGRRYIYFCPNCRKVLGLSHRKGFWMG